MRLAPTRADSMVARSRHAPTQRPEIRLQSVPVASFAAGASHRPTSTPPSPGDSYDLMSGATFLHGGVQIPLLGRSLWKEDFRLRHAAVVVEGRAKDSSVYDERLQVRQANRKVENVNQDRHQSENIHSPLLQSPKTPCGDAHRQSL